MSGKIDTPHPTSLEDKTNSIPIYILAGAPQRGVSAMAASSCLRSSGDEALFIAQRKTKVENTITLHPVAKAILDKRRGRVALEADDECIFRLPSQEGALKCLDTWIRRAGIDKHITWNSARASFSILLQDAKVDAATVALLLGHTSTKYVLNTYKRFRPKDPRQAILKLPMDK